MIWCELALCICLQFQYLGPSSLHQVLSHCTNKLFWVSHHLSRKCINSEVQSCQSFYCWIVRKHTDISSWSQASQSVDESQIVGLNENQVHNQLEWKGNCPQSSLVRKVSFFVFENSFVCNRDLSLLGNLESIKKYFSECSGCFNGEISVGGLTWSHGRVSQVENCVSDVWNFGSCGSWFGLHWLKHLSCTDAIFSLSDCLVHDILLE